MLRQNKGWTAVVVLSLALGIGANTVIFSALNSLLLKTVPVSHPEALVRLRGFGPNDMTNSESDYGYSEKGVLSTFSYPMYLEFYKSNRTMSDLFALAPTGMRLNIIFDGQAEVGKGFLVSGNYYNALGGQPLFGRILTPADDLDSAPPVGVLTEGYWKRRFGSDPNVLGKAMTINNVKVTVVGVLPNEFTGVQRVGDSLPDVTLPLAMDRLIGLGGQGSVQRLDDPANWWLEVMGRLASGSTAAQVQANLDGVFQQAALSGWKTFFASLKLDQRALSRNQNRTHVPHLLVDSGSRGMYLPSPASLQPLTILGAVVVLVLLIVCANVANLLLSRSTARQKEISIRLSLGSTRMRLMRQLLTESVVLSALGGLLGLAITYWGRTLIPGITAAQTPIDWRVFAFVALLSLATGIVFGLAPALRATRMDLTGDLKETVRGVAAGRSMLSKVLLVGQVATSLMLLIAAGLFLSTLGNLKAVNVGFNPQSLLMFRVNPALNRYDRNHIDTLYRQIGESLRAIPGVKNVTFADRPQLTGGTSSTRIYVNGHETEHTGDNQIKITAVAPDFFSTMEMPIFAGRALTEQDVMAAAKVAVINETAARKFFSDADPVGERFGFIPEGSSVTEVVGVVRDAKYNSLRDAAPPIQYVPLAQRPNAGSVIFEVRTMLQPTSILSQVRNAVHQIDPNLPVIDVTTQMDEIAGRFSDERTFALAYSLFGGLALLVACIGLFGLMSYSVARRTNEMGIRMALGAERGDVVRLVMSESLVLVLIGVVVGLVASLAASRLIASLLFGLSATDPVTIVLAVLLMIGVSAFAGYLPARRAATVDPIQALHYE
jgi:predicted permease